MSDTFKATIEFTKSDADYLNAYKQAVELLYGVVIEMLTTERTVLLSPVFREIVLDKAREVEQKHRAIHVMLCVDNPAKPLGAKEAP